MKKSKSKSTRTAPRVAAEVNRERELGWIRDEMPPLSRESAARWFYQKLCMNPSYMKNFMKRIERCVQNEPGLCSDGKFRKLWRYTQDKDGIWMWEGLPEDADEGITTRKRNSAVEKAARTEELFGFMRDMQPTYHTVHGEYQGADKSDVINYVMKHLTYDIINYFIDYDLTKKGRVNVKDRGVPIVEEMKDGRLRGVRYEQ